MDDGQYDEVNVIASLSKPQIRAPRSLDIGRPELAENTATLVVELGVTRLPVDDRDVQQILRSRLGIQRYPNFKFVCEHSRERSRMFDEQVLVTLANYVSHAEEKRRQQNEVHHYDACSYVIRQRLS